MKSIIWPILAVLILSGCDIINQNQQSQLTSAPTGTPIIPPTVTATPVPIGLPSPTVTPLPNQITGAIYSSGSVWLWDGDHWLNWKSGVASYIGDRKISVDDYVYQIPATGLPTDIKRLPVTPDWITETGGIYYSVKTATGQTSVFANATETIYPWTATGVIKMAGNDILIQRTSSGEFSLSGQIDFLQPKNGKPLVYDYDSSARTAKIRDESGVPKSVTWSTNFFGNSRDWLKSGSIWYSTNGFTWNGTTLTKDGSIMKSWVAKPYPAPVDAMTETATILAVGNRVEAGEAVNYWLEANSGYLFRQTPSIDKLEQVGRLYIGDGIRTTALQIEKTIDLKILGEYIYFRQNGDVYRYYIYSGTVTQFFTNAVFWRFP